MTAMALRRMIYGVLRAPRCRGFGVQSPSAYHFIRSVACERWPFFAYKDLAAKWEESRRERSLHQFYLRLANWLQPETCVMPKQRLSAVDYLKAGCNKVIILEKHPKPDLVIIDAADYIAEDGYELCRKRLSAMLKTVICVVESIYQDRNTRLLWQKIVSDPHTSACFDLYDCGLVFFDKNFAKRCYNIILPCPR